MSYRLLAQPCGAHTLLKGRRTLRTSGGFTAMVEVLVHDLQTTIARLAPGRTLVHAGVVGIGGSALLLPGAPGAGKSTLVAALLRAGAEYASDEFAVLDTCGQVWPYARWLALRDGDGVRRIPAASLTSRMVSGPLPVRTIVFTAYRAGSTFAARPLPVPECVLRLLAHCPGARARPEATLRALRAAAEGAAAVQGVRGEADHAAGILLAAGAHVQSPAD